MAKAKAKSKTKKPTTKTQKTKPKPVPVEKGLGVPSGERVELGLLAAHPELDGRSRDAFRSQCSDARAESFGTRTKARSVLGEARKWAVQIDRTLSQARPGQTIRYSAARLAFFLESIVELAETLAREQGNTAAAGVAAGSVAVAEQRARSIRNDLLLALEEIADGNDGLGAELEAARGGSSPSALVDSLRALADLGTRWASSFDPALHALVESVELTRDDLGAARAAADALASAIGGKTTASPRKTNDSAAVNRIEGRVLFEMGKAMTPINAAAARGIGTKLVPTAATSAVLTTHAKKSAGKADDAATGSKPATA